MLVREMRIGLDGDGGVVDYGEILERKWRGDRKPIGVSTSK
jgi:hypothetical protein